MDFLGRRENGEEEEEEGREGKGEGEELTGAGLFGGHPTWPANKPHARDQNRQERILVKCSFNAAIIFAYT